MGANSSKEFANVNLFLIIIFHNAKFLNLISRNLILGFIDAITLDQVNDSENHQLIKDIAKLVCNREMNVQLILNDKPSVSDDTPVK